MTLPVHLSTITHLSFFLYHTHTHTQGGGVLASCSVWQITKCHTSGLYSVKTAEQNPHSGAGGGGGARQEKHQTAAEGTAVFWAQSCWFHFRITDVVMRSPADTDSDSDTSCSLCLDQLSQPLMSPLQAFKSLFCFLKKKKRTGGVQQLVCARRRFPADGRWFGRGDAVEQTVAEMFFLLCRRFRRSNQEDNKSFYLFIIFAPKRNC